MSNQQIVISIQQTLVEGFKKFSSGFLTDCGEILGIGGGTVDDVVPLVFGDPVYGEKNPVFVDFLMPGTIIIIIFFLAIGIIIYNYKLEELAKNIF